MAAARTEDLDWSSVYMIEHRPDARRVLVYADVPGVEPGRPAATLAAASDIEAAIKSVRANHRFDSFGHFWIDLRKLRHTRDGSTALLSFGLSGGRIATVQVPSEVLGQIRTRRQTCGRASAPRRKPALVS